MSQHDPLVAMRHILTHAREACQLLEGKERSALDQDRLLGLGLVRLLEIVGEAATRVPEETRSQCPRIPWSQIVGLRNRLIHGYDLVDCNIVWKIVKEDLPPLVTELERFLSEKKGEEE